MELPLSTFGEKIRTLVPVNFEMFIIYTYGYTALELRELRAGETHI